MGKLQGRAGDVHTPGQLLDQVVSHSATYELPASKTQNTPLSAPDLTFGLTCCLPTMHPSSLQDMAAAGELSGHSIPQLRQLLVTVFGLLFGAGLSASSAPSSSSGSAAAHAAGSTAGGSGGSTSTSTAADSGSGSIKVISMLKELKACPLLPLYGSQGALVPARAGDGSAAVFFPVEGLGANTVQASTVTGKPSRGSR